MTARALPALWLASMLLAGAAVIAAQPDPAALEPAVDTSAAPAQSAPTQPSAPPAKPADAPARAPAPTPVQAPAPPPAAPPQRASRNAAPRADAATPAPATGVRARDRLELEATQITGNRELPRVMYVVPWKKSDPGDLGGRPANSLLDEVLAPVDRDVFLRQNRYYDALKPDAGEAAGAAPAN